MIEEKLHEVEAKIAISMKTGRKIVRMMYC